ncbi:serine hydrolase domain-containing protein [Aeromicrobium sp. Leaf350]|uniref:serine hydrolase domain-containing protein n=1 Tax=Aeromicrobium sp. Leaf350 TaxID=2876565 RepID=UPI001E4D5959|nr:serine hydrolase domain-containing protein [Aeromicrobium sp. Leaf350]
MSDELHGTADPRFAHVKKLVGDNLQSGEELGLSLHVDIHGETVLDLWGGYADAARERPWREDTIVNVWSSTKPVTNMAALLLADRGLINLSAPVAEYWPEFAANGKGSVEVRHLMSHTSGVSGWETPWVIEDMYDWERSTEQLARQAPWWEPGTASGYHACNLGQLVGEVVRRVTGMTLKEFVRTEIAAPLGADFQIGVVEADDPRVAEIIPPPPIDFDLSALPPDHPMVKTFTGPVGDARAANTLGWRRADMGAHNGHGNARSLARTLSPISRGGVVDGTKMLSPDTIDRIFEEQANGIDLVLGIPLRWGLGFALPEPQTVPSIPDNGRRTCFWGGWGGSMVVMHPDDGVTIAYAMNKMAPGIIGSDRSNAYIAAIYEALS